MTHAKQDRPTRRIVVSAKTGDELVLEVYATKLLLRPRGARRGGPAEVEIAPAVLYQRLLAARPR